MTIYQKSRRFIYVFLALGIAMLFLLISVQQLSAFAFIFAGESNGIDVITHPIGYTGTGGTLVVTVGIDPTSVNASDMVTSVQNVVNIWNRMEPTTANLQTADVPGGAADFESVLLHEMGHSIGLAHPNAATESGLSGSDRNYTKATDGANNVFDIDAGTDGIIGSSDDIRGDDVNLHWYNNNLNNPFAIPGTVDTTTYSRDLGNLPAGHTFAANADRDVSVLLGVTLENPNRSFELFTTLSEESPIAPQFGAFEAYQNPDGTLYVSYEESLMSEDGRWAEFFAGETEAVMQQGVFSGEAQRTLNHDDVAGILLAETGLDGVAGTADDYDLVLEYVGFDTGADIVIDFDDSETGFAVSQSGGAFLSANHVVITTNKIFFNNTNAIWYFNPTLTDIPEIEVFDGNTSIADGVNTVDFGTTTVGTPITKTFTISNTGTGNLTLSNLSLPGGYSVDSAFSSPVGESSATTLIIQLDAGSASTFAGTLSFDNNDSDENPFNFTITGQVNPTPAPEIAVSVDGGSLIDGGTLDFGSTTVGTPVSKTLTINNTGTADLTLTNLTSPASYSILTMFTSPVSGGSSTTLVIQLDAASISTFAGTVSFDTNDSDENPFNFDVTGEVTAVPEPEIQVSVDGVSLLDGGTIDFGATTVGTPVTQTLVISNTGTADLTLSNLSLPSGVSVDTAFSSPVAAGNGTELIIQLDATGVSSLNDTASFDTNDADEDPFDFTLLGEVEPVPEPEIAVSVEGSDVPDGGSVDFGSTTAGSAITRTFTVSNTGTSTLTLANLSVPAGFAIAADFGVTDVATDTETTFVIELTAVAAGNYSGTLSFDNNDSTENPYDIFVEGVVTEVPAPEIAVSVDSTNVPNGTGLVDFGSTVIGNMVTETVTIENVGTADLIVSNFTVPTGFTVTAPVSVTIPAAGDTTISLTLEAAMSDLYSGTVSFDTNDADENPFTFTVEGNVTDTPEPEIQLLYLATNLPDGGSLDLGSTPFGVPIVTELTVRNIGTAALTLTETITVPNGYMAEIGDTVLSPDSSTLLTITLMADTAGNYDGTVSVGNNDSDENPFNFEISGTVEEELLPEIEVFDGITSLTDGVSTVDLGTTAVGTPLTKTITVVNSGTADLTLSGLVVSGSGFSLESDLGSTTLAPSEFTDFVVQLDGTTAGDFSGTVTFANNDDDENPFSFALSGTVEESGGLAIYLPLITR